MVNKICKAPNIKNMSNLKIHNEKCLNNKRKIFFKTRIKYFNKLLYLTEYIK